MKINNGESLRELQDFVTTQAAEDAALRADERNYQEKLVADVLGQEAPNGEILKYLIDLYQTKKQAV